MLSRKFRDKNLTILNERIRKIEKARERERESERNEKEEKIEMFYGTP